MSAEGCTRAGILLGCSSLGRGSREAEVGFEPQTFRSVNSRPNHLGHLVPQLGVIQFNSIQFISYKPCVISTLVPAATVSITGKPESGTYNQAKACSVCSEIGSTLVEGDSFDA
ncbi:hypothetical protein T265_04976 [Opisthorchis viverrini]|uniref:Uncharacterized protein n=1 Tax=Opisthorchis viverrini TaxID=6198 RepID=A0A074ZXX0_OPIVI|nr:hypothetical protein T265_04976 [Opisthorchis viverrini]KER28145.1 hypothetical protein T265_04976 [Opisthorchis viverrini]